MKRLTRRMKNSDKVLSLKSNEEIIHKLADYEDAEEDGRIIIIPVQLGTTLYVAHKDGINYGKVISVNYEDNEVELTMVSEGIIGEWYLNAKLVGKQAFTTFEEAVAKMKEMGDQ